jgi:ArsR family transcriptional regulator
MTTMSSEARALAALGNDARLSIFRLLIKAGDGGLNVGQIGAHLGIAPSTLAHHLGMLVDAGLVAQERLGREVVNRASFDAIRRLSDFLVAECCSGVPVFAAEEAAG